MKRYRVPLVAAGALALGVGLMAAPAQAAQQHHRSSGPVVVVSGLNNPRQLALTNHSHRLLIAEAGCTAKQIQAITGHKTLAEVERYTRKADQVRLALEEARPPRILDHEGDCIPH